MIFVSRVISQALALTFILISLSSVVQEKQHKLYFDMDGSGGWVPFLTASEVGKPGIVPEITEAMQRYADIKFIPLSLPQKRAEIALKDGVVDVDFICLEWLKEGVVGSEYVTSEPFFEITESFITLKKNAELFPTRESLLQKRIGTISGYFYFDDISFVRTDFLNEKQLMLGLKHERFDVIIMEQEAAKHWAKVHDIEINFAILHSKGNLLMRINKKHQSLLPAINHAIKQIKITGELQVILDKHNAESKIY